MNLNQITIKSNDVNRSVEFYQKLGLRLIIDSRPSYARLECQGGESTFSISHSDVVIGNSTVLYFEVDEVDKSYMSLISQGIKFNSEPKDMRWLWREAHFSDPNGNPLILFTAGENRKNPPWRILPIGEQNF